MEGGIRAMMSSLDASWEMKAIAASSAIKQAIKDRDKLATTARLVCDDILAGVRAAHSIPDVSHYDVIMGCVILAILADRKERGTEEISSAEREWALATATAGKALRRAADEIERSKRPR